jgi:hypothetical protein
LGNLFNEVFFEESMSNKKSILQMTGRFLWFAFFAAIIITSCVLMKELGPEYTAYSDDEFDWTYTSPLAATNDIIFDQHSHTLYSDGSLTVRQNILWHIAQGFNAMVLSDHETIANQQELASLRAEFSSQILLIQGVELTTDRIHMNFINIKTWDYFKFWLWDEPSDAQIQEAIDYAHAQDAIVVVNHIPWTERGTDSHPSRSQLLAWGVDYIEIVSDNEYDADSIIWCNRSEGFGVITGTDMHGPGNVYGWTGLNVTEFTIDAVMTQLYDKNTTIYYDAVGVPSYAIGHVNPWYRLAEPMILIGNLFENYFNDGLDWAGVLIFVGYLVGVFFFSEAMRVVNRKFWERKNRKIEEKVEK